MVNVEEALESVRAALAGRLPGMERVPLDEALGRVMGRDVVLDHDLPPFRRASMDGFAVAAADARARATLRVLGRVAAGDGPGPSVAPGAAQRINTGGVVPRGADRVLPVEWCRLDGDRVHIDTLPSDAAYVVEAGTHVRQGEVVVSAGRRIDAGTVGVLATAGVAAVPVARRPDVAVLPTGTELLAVEAPMTPGRIRNSNAPMLRAEARSAGARAHDLGVAVDELDALGALVRRGLDHDILVLSGGVSKGDLDLVPDALAAEGVECVFHRWAVQPGGPLWFGTKEGVLVFGLPGNPAASFVGFELLVVPAIHALLGRPFAGRRRLRARYEGPWGRAASRRRFRPVELDTDDAGALVARALPWSGSGDPLVAMRSSALAALPENVDAPAAESALVDVYPLERLE